MPVLIDSAPAAGQDIALQTRKRWNIPNGQVTEISILELNNAKLLLRRYSTSILDYRTDPTPIYNCHGLTFASRRTGIYEVSAIHKILDDDEYKRVEIEAVLPGDAILYFDEDGDIEHSGIVVSRPQATLKVPQVVSKWGKFQEVIHWASQCPYNYSTAKYYRIKN